MVNTTPGRVLYVEDDELVRRAGVQSLQLAGFDAAGFANAEGALPLVDADFAGVSVAGGRAKEEARPGRAEGLWLAHARDLPRFREVFSVNRDVGFREKN